MMLTTEQLGYRYGPAGDWIFRDLDLAVPRGAVCASLGPNGRGKTTLLKALLGVLTPREGRLRVAGSVGYVPQSLQAPFPYRSLDMVVMGRARHIGLFASPQREDYAIALDALTRLGAAQHAERPVTELSGGERQLVMIARAVASQADLLILDEPASALDYYNQQAVLRALAELARRDGKTVVFTTHNPQHALAVADHALALHRGGGYEMGPVDAVLSEHRLSELYGLTIRCAEVHHHDRAVRGVFPIFEGCHR